VCTGQMNVSDRGAQCNRAIMLITDGAPDTYEDIFAKYNWPNKDVRSTRCCFFLLLLLSIRLCCLHEKNRKSQSEIGKSRVATPHGRE